MYMEADFPEARPSIVDNLILTLALSELTFQNALLRVTIDIYY
jgi:hypothetical protein